MHSNTPLATAGQLIPLTHNDGAQAVMGRDLHQFLGLGRDYTTWFNKMVTYGFEQGKDFTPLHLESTGGRPARDHVMTLGMANKVAGFQRTTNGDRAVQFFTTGIMPPPVKEDPRPVGSVYFIQAPEVGMVKIGHSTNVEHRLRSLSTMPPTNLVLAGCIPGDIAKERRLHRAFVDFRSHGEWFHVSGELKEFMHVEFAPANQKEEINA